MSIYYSGTFTKSAGVISAIVKQLKKVNLKPVKKIQVQFDPFHEKAVTAREFLRHISAPKVVNTNLNCVIKTNIVCDRSEPQIKVDLVNNKSLRFLGDNLSVLEILQHLNKHLDPLIEKEDTTVIPAVKAKIQQKLKHKLHGK